MEFVHPDDRAAHAHAFAPLLAGERADARYQHRFLTASGAERWAEVQVRAISGWDGLPTGFVGVMRDVTDERRAQQHVAAEQAVMRLLSSARRARGRGRRACSRRSAASSAGTAPSCGGWPATSACAASPTGPRPGVRLDRFMAAGAALGYEVGDGFPGQAWMSRVPLWETDVTGDRQPRAPRRRRVADGIRSTVALPLRAAGEPVGVVVLVSRTPREPEPGLERLLEAIGGHVTQFLQRREAEGRAAEQAEDLKKLSAVAHELAGQTDLFAARMTLTPRGARRRAPASSVMLWEPTAAGDELEVTAAVGRRAARDDGLAGRSHSGAGDRVPDRRARVRGRRRSPTRASSSAGTS